MNYLAHGFPYVDDPYFLAGTAIPDWLGVVNRRMRVRSKQVAPFVNHGDPRVAALAGGILQHHADDRWFHQTRAFAELNLQLTVAVRDVLSQEEGFRPSFLGHILVEILLDATLIVDDPSRLDDYYAALEQIEAGYVAQVVNEELATCESPLLAGFIAKFCSVRFLYDYVQDEKLLFRLNQVMGRVKLPPLPDALLEILPPARRDVRRRRDELLAGLPGGRIPSR
jgi:hypothetical protein